MKIYNYCGYIYIISALRHYTRDYEMTILFVTSREKSEIYQLLLKKRDMKSCNRLILKSNSVILVKNMKLLKSMRNRICYYGYDEEYYEVFNDGKVKEFKKKVINWKIFSSITKILYRMNENHLMIEDEVLDSSVGTLPLLKLLLLSNRVKNQNNAKTKKMKENLLKEINRIKRENKSSCIEEEEDDDDDEEELMEFPELEEDENNNEVKEKVSEERDKEMEERWEIRSESTIHNNSNNESKNKIYEFFNIQNEMNSKYPPLTEALLKFHNTKMIKV